MKKKYKCILGIFALLLLIGGWWSYRLIWGKPLNIDHFYERVFIEIALDDPELFSSLGFIDNTLLDFHSDDLTDSSPRRDKELAQKIRRDLESLRSYSVESQSDSQRLSTEILEWFLDDAVRSEEFLFHNYPVNQLFGIQSNLPSFMESTHQVINEKSAENYLSRLSKFGTKFDQVIEGLKLREDRGIVPPKFVIEKVLVEMNNFVSQPVEENILFSSFKLKMVDIEEFDDQKREKYLEEASIEIEKTVHPAYRKLIAFFEALEAKATTDDGVWKLPDGDAYYAYQLRSNTTSDYTPEEVHQIGLSEVARIQGEMTAILERLGQTGKPVAETMRLLAEEKQFQYPNTDVGRENIVRDYVAIVDEIDAGVSEVFNVRPKMGMEVKRIPEFKQETAPMAYYQSPAMDGSRPGVFYVNLRDLKNLPKFSMRTLVYHEGIPGHHFQLAIAQELEGLPTFRKIIPFTAYVEGWALYTERLAWELGYQKDPHDNLGRLQDELLRAVRLVVDTGIHYKKWTREEAIEYMLANTGTPEGEVVTEIERYIVIPGQACAYKIGMLKILELREKAKSQLGDKFKLSDFHDVVLKNGAMPLSVLEKVVDTYIEDKAAS